MAAGFDAFISYSRRASAGLATDLQSAVERFAKPWYRLRAVRVFRDDASMSANVALWSSIEAGLKQAEWFVLLASPAAASSQYVANEITWWLENKSSDRILIVLEEGVDIVWDRAANDFDWERTDSLPRALSGAYAEEPRWIDLRWYEEEGSLKKADPQWEERVADVAAAIRFAERDQLIGENVRQHKRARLLLRAGVATLSVLLVASLVATVIAIGQRSEAQRQTRIAVEQREEAQTQARIALARQLAAQAVALAPTDLQTASLLAVQAFRTNDDAQTRAAMFQIATASPQLVRSLPVGSPVRATAVTPSGVVVTGDEDGRIIVWDGASPTTVITLDRPVVAVAVSDDARVVAAADDQHVVRWDGATAEMPGTREVTGVAVSRDGAVIAAANVNDGEVTLWPGTAQPQTVTDVHAGRMAFTERGLVTLLANGSWSVIDIATSQVRSRGQLPIFLNTPGTAISADGSTLAAAVREVDVRVWRGKAAYRDLAEPNAVASTSIIRAEIALSADGSVVARAGDGFIEVARVRGLRDPFVRPLRLEGAGGAPFGTLSFGGDHYLASGNGASALLWDVDQLYRFGRSVRTPVPVGCQACGPGRIAISPDGAKAAMWALGDFGTGPVVADLGTGDSTSLDPQGSLGLESLAWDGDERIIGFAAADSTLVALDPGGGPPTTLTEVEVDDSVLGLVVVRETIWLITRTGLLVAVDVDSGRAERVASLVEDPRAANAYYWGIAPDGGSAYLTTSDENFQPIVMALDIGSGQLVFEGPGLGAAYDSESRLHVFDGETVRTIFEGKQIDERPAPTVASTPAPIVAPDGTLVVTGGTTTDISLLDLTRQGTLVGTVPVPKQDNVYPSSAFTPDGDALVTALPAMDSLGLPSTLRTLSLDPTDWIAAACAVAARDLTEEDWDRYGVGPAPDDLRCVQ